MVRYEMKEMGFLPLTSEVRLGSCVKRACISFRILIR